jgi:hypothetical protein
MTSADVEPSERVIEARPPRVGLDALASDAASSSLRNSADSAA